MLEAYFPIFIFLAMGVLFGLVPVILGMLVGPNRPSKAKQSTYECGFLAYESPRLPFDVRFYLVAILFIIFDLETAFLFPWAVVFRDLGWLGFWAMVFFLFLLTIGFIYEWKKGALEWE